MYDVVESRSWKNTKTGATASLYGACPWVRDAEKSDWTLVVNGWTVRNQKSGTVGIGRMPWKEKSQALAWLARQAARFANVPHELLNILETVKTTEVVAEDWSGTPLKVEQDCARFRFTWSNGDWSDWFILHAEYTSDEEFPEYDLFTLVSKGENGDSPVKVSQFREELDWSGQTSCGTDRTSADPVVAIAQIRRFRG